MKMYRLGIQLLVCWLLIIQCGSQQSPQQYYPDGGSGGGGPGSYGPQPSRMDALSRMGEDLMIRLRSSFGGSSLGSSMSSIFSGGGSDGDCCGKDFNTYVIGITLVFTIYVFFFLLNATVTSGRRRRRRMLTSGELEQDPEMLLDGPTWLSMVHELWEQDGALQNTACTQETLCRMNRLAMAAPGQAGWAVSLSSLPLGYLLHTRHNGGFSSYMDASLMGRSGVNCTELFSSCPRLH